MLAGNQNDGSVTSRVDELANRQAEGGGEGEGLSLRGQVHIPARAGFTLTVDTLAAIKDRVPHFCGLKNTDTDIGFVTGAFARLARDFRIFAGLELPTLPMLGIGG